MWFEQADRTGGNDAFEFLLDDLEDRREVALSAYRVAVEQDNLDRVSQLAALRKRIKQMQQDLSQLQDAWRLILEETTALEPSAPESDSLTQPMAPIKPRATEPIKLGVTRTVVNPPLGKYSYTMDGRVVPGKRAIRLVIRLLKELGAKDPTFLERFAKHPDHGEKRTLIARSRDGLYHASPHLADDRSEQFAPGWWNGTNYSVKELAKRLQIAQQVSRHPFTFDFGSEAL